MMADLNSMDPIQRACFDKKQMVIWESDAWSHIFIFFCVFHMDPYHLNL
jgi:hypothetical protein